TDWAAWRNAWVARLTPCSVRERSTLPPERSFCGASPSQEQQCFTVGNWLIAVPTSARMVCAREAERPVTATRSTPVRRARDVRALSPGWCFDCEPGLTRGTDIAGSSEAQRGFIAAHGR